MCKVNCQISTLVAHSITLTSKILNNHLTIDPNGLIEKMNMIRKILQRIKGVFYVVENLPQHFDEIKINQGRILSLLNQKKTNSPLNDYEFKIFSQWGEDGIIQHLINSLEVKNKTFIEFGVEDFTESNCRFLLMKDNWRGFVVDGSPSNINNIKQSYFYWRYDLNAYPAFITINNINEILKESGFEEDLGILSIDIDGNDWFILEAISFYKPRILICEYNDVFGKERAISVPYDPQFVRTKKHYSNLYFGASIAALTYLAEKKGYALVGVNSNHNNAFFIRQDLLCDSVPKVDLEEIYEPSNIRESRNESGRLTHLAGDERLALLKGLPILNVKTNALESL